MDKEFVDPPQRLKTDVELKVGEAGADRDADAARDEKSSQDGQQNKGPDPKNATATISPTGLRTDPVFDRARMNADKRARELAFLKEYDAKQVRTRIKLAIIGAFIFVTISSFLSFVGRQGERSIITIAALQPVSLFAALGEGDLAYFQMSRFPWWKKNLTPNMLELEQRNKILNKAALDFEKTGHLAVLTRLGAEEMNIKLGNREAGLKFGDDLIARYPTLPSNYFWRANIFYEQGEYNQALKSYDQAASLLKTAAEGKAWLKELPKPIWSGLKSGRFAEANKYIQLFEQYGGNSADVNAFKSLISIVECESLNAPQLKAAGLWNSDLEQAYKKRLDSAIAFGKSISDGREWDVDFEYIDKDDLLSRASILKGDYSQLKRNITTYETYASHYANSMKAQLAIIENKPAAALATIGPDPDYDYYQLPFYRASALQQLHRSAEAIATADKVLSIYGRSERNTMFILRTRMIKAKALLDSGHAKEALTECDAVLKHNARMMDAHLIKLNCLQKLHRSSEEIAERNLITRQLNDFSNGYSVIGSNKQDER